MVCGDCGTRNLPDARFCVRCGSRVIPAEAPEQLATPPPPPSPAEKQALVARELLANGRVREATEAANAAATLEPEAVLPHLVLGEIHEHTGALDDALWEYRRAAGLNPGLTEAREKAEAIRRQIVHPHVPAPATPREAIRAALARIPRKLIPVIAGLVAGLLVFTVGGAAIVVNTSPRFLARRAFERQMALGSTYYRQGRYGDAAESFRVAQQIDPSSAEAMNRLGDAERMAGALASPGRVASLPPAAEARTDVAKTPATPDRSAFPATWIGPAPGGAAASAPSRAPATSPPPYIPAPAPTRSDTAKRPELPPLPPSTPKSTQPFESFEGRSRQLPGAESPSPTPGSEPVGATEGGQSKPPPGKVTIWVNPPRRAASPTPVQPQAPTMSAADEARKVADRLQQAGRYADAARQYAGAETLYREEASQGGPNRAIKGAAADSCRDARRLCESQVH